MTEVILLIAVSMKKSFLESVTSMNKEVVKVCPNGHKLLSPTTKFCSECGAALENKVKKTYPVIDTQAAVDLFKNTFPDIAKRNGVCYDDEYSRFYIFHHSESISGVSNSSSLKKGVDSLYETSAIVREQLSGHPEVVKVSEILTNDYTFEGFMTYWE